MTDSTRQPPGAIDELLPSEGLGRVLTQVTGDVRWTMHTQRLIVGGKSNLTFEISCPAGTLIVRRPPAGPLARGAHDMRREVRVQRALRNTTVPVPSIVHYQDATDAFDTPFYVMRKVTGHVIRDQLPKGYGAEPHQLQTISHALVDVLAGLHTIEPGAVGLTDFGHAQGFLGRQLTRWNARLTYEPSERVPELEALAEGLHAKMPRRDSAAIVHGDFRLDNCIMAPENPAYVAAVLDWELSTIADPLTDLGLFMAYWPHPGEWTIPLVPAITADGGFPSRTELATRYAASSGADVSDLPYFEAFARFKLAVILQDVVSRARRGAMAGQNFEVSREDVARIAHIGLTVLESL